MLKKLRNWLNRFEWQFGFLTGVLMLSWFIQATAFAIAKDLEAVTVAFATVPGFVAICFLSWSLVISLRIKGFFSPLNCLKPGERWQARLKKEDDHITIELSPFSSDHPRPSDGSEYYDVSFKISDS